MNKILGLFIFYFIIGVANTILTEIYIPIAHLPGGDVGMMSILIAVGSLIFLALALVIVIAVTLLKLKLTYVKGIIVYFAIYFILTGFEAINNIFDDLETAYLQLNVVLLLIPLLLGIISILIAKRLDSNAKNAQ